jgi:transcriptional regulator with PAS, ATPase and Fis domain
MSDAITRNGLSGLIGASAPMQELYDEIERAAATDSTIFVSGESGSGKELVVSAIHERSARRHGPLVKVNGSALPESLFESELFGHARGSFTGAVADRVGRFEAAAGGTIFFDEIGDLPLPVQVKLLRVLQERVVERVGDHKPIPIDARVISATHMDLNALVRAGRFRADLYYRLHVFPIRVPALRAHLEDVPAIARSILERLRARYGRGPLDLSPGALEAILRHAWPGNVRELANAIEVASAHATGALVAVEDLPPELSGGPDASRDALPRGDGRRDDATLILEALREANGCRSTVARRLGISRTTLWRRMRHLGLPGERLAG